MRLSAGAALRCRTGAPHHNCRLIFAQALVNHVPRQVAVGPGVMGQNRSYNGRANSVRATLPLRTQSRRPMSSNSAAHKRSWILSSGSTGRSRSSRQRFASSRYFFGVFMGSPHICLFPHSLAQRRVGAWIYFSPVWLPKSLVPEEVVMDPAPAPFGGMLDRWPTPGLPMSASAVC